MNKLKKMFSALFVVLLALSGLISGGSSSLAASTVDTAKAVDLTIHKYKETNLTGLPGSSGDELDLTAFPSLEPLENISFNIYKTNINFNAASAADLPDAATVLANPATYGVDLDVPSQSGTTDTNGEAKYTIAAADQGIYLVTEVANPVVEDAEGIPFLISLPSTNKDGTDWNYDVHAYPKNKLKDGPNIKKEVETADVTNKGVNVGDDVKWRIISDIPKDLYYTDSNSKEVYGKKFEMVDILSKGLEYKGVSFMVDGSAFTLTPTTDYTAVTTPQGADTKLTFSLTKAGMKKVAQAGTATYPLFTLEVLTTVTQDALTVDKIENKATLNYTNSIGVDFVANTDDSKVPGDPSDPVDPTKPTVPEVHTGSTGFVKLAAGTSTALSNVKFAIANTEANAKAGKYVKKTATGKIVFPGEAQYDSAADYIVESNATGEVVFEGLKYGNDNESWETAKSTYYVVETQAKDGYQLLKNPVALEVSKNSDLAAKLQSNKVYNNKGFTLPKTGSAASIILIAAGLLTLFAAYLISRKSRKEA
ncbi:SpaH/EbpB family LPXTG-anchored major pilin [Enterococcus raffinosus]|uniref:SpaH/EbpB family LPXTG-anchored major pilin n=1 Tax=Enterococcus raffinosus TaxID=71452 RepID=UPI001C46B789|nr:SpaH/EbpB family LPXTG-anchored major pilin [Enterococcus raffinosus]MDT2572587.1 SpaH/EbpB family LPXTG-anchored major pilin [Enterococcus raffinosus]QXJ60128.1 SpaH/EbpB family LPXTG-anchored major pilin [Enterococcus raffinosus]